MDYLIVLVQKYDNRIAEIFKKINSNNSQCDELYKIMAEPFDQNKWDDMKKDTALFKLSWKYEYPIEKNGKETFYGRLCDRKLI